MTAKHTPSQPREKAPEPDALPEGMKRVMDRDGGIVVVPLSDPRPEYTNRRNP